VILVPGITLILIPFSEDMGLFLLHFFGLNIFHYICLALSVVAVTVFCVSMVYDASKLRNYVAEDHTGFSLWSLALQAIAFIVLGVAQYLRPDPQAGWEMKNKILEWYLVQGKVSVNYFIAAGGHVIAFALRLFYGRVFGSAETV
jgi:hypothetical protein